MQEKNAIAINRRSDSEAWSNGIPTTASTASDVLPAAASVIFAAGSGLDGSAWSMQVIA